MTLAEQLRQERNDVYASFKAQYEQRILDECAKAIRHHGHYYKGVYDDGSQLMRECSKSQYEGLNFFIKVLRDNGFNVTAFYWCGGACQNADGFKATL